ncbi:MAG: DUF2065 domain-containing protein [Proteobacteria bacterium]|jgi:uncharacterized protein|nr:DUF2065 domain-containing protein [Pseudomonadota bacterium]
MADFVTALGLLLVIEGALYALFPDGMQRMMRAALETPSSRLRNGGIAALLFGFAIVWFVRS